MPAAGPLKAEDAAPVFGMLNPQSPPQTAERLNSILEYLGRKAGSALRLGIGTTVERTSEMMASGQFDFVFTNHNFKLERRWPRPQGGRPVGR